MDVIGDTALAIESYLEKIDQKESQGYLYVLLYGVLQILFVQQDAVRHLSEALDLDYENDPTLKKIRDIRNDSIGHPTQRGWGDDASYNFIIRGTMTRTEFTYMKTLSDRSPKIIQVDVLELISDQRIVLTQVLSDVVEKLKKEEMEHREKFKDEKLVDVFPQTLHYYYEKMFEVIFGGAPKEFGKGILEIVEEVPKELKNALLTRNIYDAYDLEHDFELTEHSILKLKQYFESSTADVLSDNDAYIYLTFLKHRLGLLKEVAEDIDDVYQSNQNAPNPASS